MVSLDLGRVCLKIAGREGGKYCVIVKPAGKSKEDKSFVFVTGPRVLTGVKRRRANITHLQPTEHKLEIKEDAPDEEVIDAFEKVGLISKLNLKKPSAGMLKSAKVEEAKEKKEKKKTEKKPKKKEKKK